MSKILDGLREALAYARGGIEIPATTYWRVLLLRGEAFILKDRGQMIYGPATLLLDSEKRLVRAWAGKLSIPGAKDLPEVPLFQFDFSVLKGSVF
jgi:hypothetical protein